MKCWECRKKIKGALRVRYVSYLQNIEKYRGICAECYYELTFNDCHFVEVKKITRSRTLRKGVIENDQGRIRVHLRGLDA